MDYFDDLPGVIRPRLKPTREMGVPGFDVIGGWLQSKERNPRLVGWQRYITASDLLTNCAIVAAGLNYFLNLVASAEWSVEPVDDTAGAKKYAEFVEDCMNDMEVSWHRVIRRSGMFRFYGFGVQEWTAKRRPDGQVGFRTVEARPQFTIERWDVDPTGRVRGMIQRSPHTMLEYYLPRAKTIYLVDDTFSDSPEGFGLMRNLVSTYDRYQDYMRIEGQGFERDFRGIPIGYAPRAEIAQAIKAGKIDRETGERMIAGLEDMVRAQAKGEATGLLLDSSTYWGQDGNGGVTPSSVKKWGIELLSGTNDGLDTVGKAIDRLVYDMAMIIGVESLLLGRESGNRALSTDKSRNLYLIVNSCLKDIVEGFDKDYVDPLWKLNGFPDEMRPHLKAEDVSFRSVEQVTAALKDMAGAGAMIAPDDPVVNDVRDLLGVSRAPDEPLGYKGM